MMDLSPYPSAVISMLDERLPELGPGQPHEPLRGKLQALSLESLAAGHKLLDRDAANCCLAGLWLLHDFLDESHRLSQEIHTPEGSYWHGILHRREPDYNNAKYWFRRAGSLSFFPELAAGAAQLTQGQPLDRSTQFLASGSWDPCRFVDLCETLTQSTSPQRELARQIARLEWELLFVSCWRKGWGGSITAS